MCLRCGCCTACKPRYKRLVDNIYPPNPTDANIGKLIFYSSTNPEKLDRIGEYLSTRLRRDIYRQKTPMIEVTIQAMDRILSSCHSSGRNVNLYVESFLSMVQQVLETGNIDLQMMAVDSFVKFSNIQEDVPGYHRRYDFFISKFSQLCHDGSQAIDQRNSIRLAGLRGLRGVVRKTVGDDLQANIWEPDHMNKIIPSVLYNFHDKEPDSKQPDISLRAGHQSHSHLQHRPSIADGVDGVESERKPKVLADTCLRELIGKASFGCIKPVLGPVLAHCDLHSLWIPPDNAILIFHAIIFSIQSQYSYVVIQTIIEHLDKHGADDAETRVGIAEVLAETVRSASAGIGPSLLEIFNSLLRHLRSSVNHQNSKSCPNPETERKYQDMLIEIMGNFANTLPDYQKVEMMLFIIGKVPGEHGDSENKDSSFLTQVLLKTLLKVATKYKTGYLTTPLSNSFLEPLLSLAVTAQRSSRLLTQQILHTLLDRHQNLDSLKTIPYFSDVNQLHLTVEKCDRFDQMFMKKNNEKILSSLFRSALLDDNTVDNYDALLTTLALLCIEIGCDEVVVELFRVVMGLQTSALDSAQNMNIPTRVHIHNMVAKYMNLSSQLLAIPSLCQHVHQVVKTRAQQSYSGLNLLSDDPLKGQKPTLDPVPETLEALRVDEPETLFEMETLSDALKSTARDVKALSIAYSAKWFTSDGHRSPSRNSPSIDDTSGSDSTDGGPSRRPSQRRFPGDENQVDTSPLTLQKLRQILAQPQEELDADEEKRCVDMYLRNRELPWKKLAEEQKANSRNVAENVRKILERVERKQEKEKPSKEPKSQNIFDLQLPELFVY